MEMTVLYLEICRHQLWYDGWKYSFSASTIESPVNSICNHQIKLSLLSIHVPIFYLSHISYTLVSYTISSLLLIIKYHSLSLKEEIWAFEMYYLSFFDLRILITP
jgi:hypothetical protein